MIALILFCIPQHSNAHGHVSAESRKYVKKMEQDAIDLAIPAPKDNEVCFSPDENCDAKLVKYILSAKESLDIAIYELTHRKIIDAIIAQSFKIKVRLIINKKMSKDNDGAITQLQENKVLYRVGRQKGIMNSKFTIVDGKRLETGSFNYTNAAAHSNQENQLYLSTPSILDRYKSHFQNMWEDAITH